MSTKVEQILEWDSTDGSRQSLILVEDLDVHPNDVNRKVIELAKYDSQQEKWITEETVTHVQKIESFGIPEDFID